MITNDVQYRTAKAQADRLAALLEDLGNRPLDEGGGQLRRRIETSAVSGQKQELLNQMREYDDLRLGREPVGTLSTLNDLPRLLVRARIAAGLSQRLLADRLGLKEQQVQRYEATDYASASLSRLREVADVLGVGGDALPEAAPTSQQVVKRLTDLGLDSRFVRRRLAPASLRDRESGKSDVAPVIDLASRVGRVFGWETSSLFSGETLEPDRRVLAAASFKLPETTDKEKIGAYTVYAHYLALLTLQATEQLLPRALPKDAPGFRSVWESTGSLGDFTDLVRIIWDFGIPVLPLADGGGFHAAVWHIGDRDVIVLKQGNRRTSRWAFDLLHEIGHVIAGLQGSEGSVIDGDDSSTDPNEEKANMFAGDVLLDGRAEDLVQLCVNRANGSVERLKRVVPQVAVKEGVDVGSLANYLAFRLSMQKINWWGTAANLQQGDLDPWEVCRDAFIDRADLATLNPLDRDLLAQALVP